MAPSRIEGEGQTVGAVLGCQAQRRRVLRRWADPGPLEHLLPVPPHPHRAVVAQVHVDQVSRPHLDVFDEVEESAVAADDLVGIDEVVTRRMRSATLRNAYGTKFQ